MEPGVFCLSYAALVLWHLGYPDQALRKARPRAPWPKSGLIPSAWARPGSRCPVAPVPPGKSPDPRVGRGSNHPRARARISSWLRQGTILQGWALAEQGQSEEGISQIRQGLAAHQALGAGIFQSYFLALLAEAYGKAGQAEEGLAALAEALTVVDKNGEHFYEAELYRLKGELTLQKLSVVKSQLSVPSPNPSP